MLGTSLHTIVQMVDNGLGVTMLPEMALEAGILDHTNVTARPLDEDNAVRADRAGLAPRVARARRTSGCWREALADVQ